MRCVLKLVLTVSSPRQAQTLTRKTHAKYAHRTGCDTAVWISLTKKFGL